MSQESTPTHAISEIPLRQQIVLTTSQPGLVRSILAGTGRMLSAVVITIVVFIGLGSLIVTIMGQETGIVPRVYREGSGTSLVAVLSLDDDIAPDAAAYVKEAVDLILVKPRIRGVIFRVNSPGGDVTSADQIWYEIERLKKRGLSVVSSYGSVAASGGYYVSCGSDYIFAEPTCITGSIGVIMQALTFEEVMKKVGVAPVTLVAEGSPAKDLANNMYRTWGDADRSELMPMLNSAYDLFFTRVKTGRSHVQPDEAALKAVCNGRIYTATEAVANKLVDQIGYLDDAVDHCIASANLPKDTRVLWIEPPAAAFPGLPFGLTLDPTIRDEAASSTSRNGLVRVALDAEGLRETINELARPKALYLWQ